MLCQKIQPTAITQLQDYPHPIFILLTQRGCAGHGYDVRDVAVSRDNNRYVETNFERDQACLWVNECTVHPSEEKQNGRCVPESTLKNSLTI